MEDSKINRSTQRHKRRAATASKKNGRLIGVLTAPTYLFAASVLFSLSFVIRSTLIINISRHLESSPTSFNPQQNHNVTRICFITSQFSSSRTTTDRLFDVDETVPTLKQLPHYHFFAFSNLPNLKAPGWELIVKDLSQYKRFITQSRWPKFQAFKEPKIQDTCQVVFYIDGIVIPFDNPEIFQNEAKSILNSPTKFAQRIHPVGGGAEAEFKRIRKQKKDIQANIKASLNWLQSQPDYNENCILYENNMFGYSVDSIDFQRVANYFWDHYSMENDSWRDQPLWCYALDHFNIVPRQLTGNGKDTLFKKSIGRMRKGGHRYKSEAAISTTSIDRSSIASYQSCWLDTNATASDESLKPINSIPKTNITNSRLHLICPDTTQRSRTTKLRSTGLTIGLPYYASPALLLQQLTNFASYPVEIQKLLSIVLVDDGSPVGLRAADYINNETLVNLAPFGIHFHLKVVHIKTEIDWNIEGSRNLAFYLADTRLGLMLDLDMLVPVETFKETIKWNTTIIDHETNEIVAVAHKFNRRKQDGQESFQPALGLLDIQEYWNAGGLDEDFAGHYGHGTEPHFWHLWRKGSRIIKKHEDIFLLELETDACDPYWLKSTESIDKCKSARSKMKILDKDRTTNKRLWKRKRKGKIPWSNLYLRFNWTIDIA